MNHSRKIINTFPGRCPRLHPIGLAGKACPEDLEMYQAPISPLHHKLSMLPGKGQCLTCLNGGTADIGSRGGKPSSAPSN